MDNENGELEPGAPDVRHLCDSDLSDRSVKRHKIGKLSDSRGQDCEIGKELVSNPETLEAKNSKGGIEASITSDAPDRSDTHNQTVEESTLSSLENRSETMMPISRSKTHNGKEKVIVITGPTAVGKTDVSLLVAEALNGEVVSADSVQVYKGLDIGSAKIPESERRNIPHHLIDVLNPSEDFSAGQFYEMSRLAISDILKRGKTPIVVGGTGFYLRWCIHGKPSTPITTPEAESKVKEFMDKIQSNVRKEHGEEASSSQIWSAYCKAVEDLGDMESAQRLQAEPNNDYRLRRILTILLTSGKPLAEMNHDRLAEPDYDFRCFFLSRPRTELYDRIGLRCEIMLRDGLLKEAKWMQNQGLKSNTNSATKSIGYRQALDFLEAIKQGEEPEEKPMMEMLTQLQAKSRRYCHSQLSWFRDEKLFKWVDATSSASEVAQEIVKRYQQDIHEGSQGLNGELSKEEQKQMRLYIYRNQILADPKTQHAILQQLN